jgi:predicted NBD/HSP70 family sugar kinase
MPELSRGSAKLIKDINRQISLNLILNKGPISGAELAKRTKMRPSTISGILKALFGMGLIEEVGTGKSTSQGGRKPILWKINAKGGYAIGMEVIQKRIITILMDLECHIVTRDTQKTEIFNDETQLVEKIDESVKRTLSKNQIDPKKVIGVGLGITGLVDTNKGEVLLSSVLKKRNIPLRRMLDEKMGMDVIIENDVNAAAFGENWIGLGKAAKHFIYIEVNEEIEAIGCGIVINGQVYRGASMCAGELGLMLPSIATLYRKDSQMVKDSVLHDMIGGDMEKITIETLLKAVKQKDKLALQMLEDLGEILGEETVRMVSLLNPEMVILGGDIADASDYILNPIRNAIRRKALDAVADVVKVETSSFGLYSVAVGAASLILQQVYREPSVDSRYIFNTSFLIENNLQKEEMAVL